jgi:oligopeptide transport system substrate-binding protein
VGRGGHALRARARRRAFAFVLCCVLLLAGCTHKPRGSAQPSVAAPRVGGTLQIALVSPGSLDPAQAVGAEQRLLVGNLFDSLTTLDGAGAVRPAAAASWTSDQTLRHWRFQLRPGGQFADGQPVQANDFKAAWERLASPRTRPRPPDAAGLLGLVEGYPAMAAGRARTIGGLAASDPTTLTVDLSQPFADLPTLLADPRLSPIPPNASVKGGTFASRPLGNGPFMLAKAVAAGPPFDLVRNTHYDGRAAYLDKVRIQVVPDPQTAWLAFQHGQASFAPVPPAQVPAARAIAGTSADGRAGPGVLQGPELGTWSLGFDLDSGPSKDPRWRQAVSLALDRHGIASSFPAGVASATAVVPQGVPGASAEPCSACRYDPAQARQLLDAIGGGARKPVALAIAATPFDRNVAAQIRSDLAAVGIAVKPKEVTPAALLTASGPGDAPLIGYGWSADTPRTDAFLVAPPVLRDPTVANLVAQARATPEQAARDGLYQQAEQEVSTAVPVAPVLQYRHSAVLAPGVEGFDLTPWGALDLSAASLTNPAK